MYHEHFGFKYPPFKITPNTQLFFDGGNRGLILEALIYALQSGEGIIKVVGEVGSGKTMLCRMLEVKLPKHIEIVYIANPRLSAEMILPAIALEMGLSLPPNNNRLQLMHHLHHTLLEKHAQNKQVVVFVEEAQGMPLETLEEIRLLSNLETTRHKLLQIVLFGQPELDTQLAVTHIRQLKERITHSFYLKALSYKETAAYIDFRLRAVGYRGPPLFSAAALRALTQVSKGLIRRVNILADKALLAAFAQGQYAVHKQHIYLAARDSHLIDNRFSWRFAMITALLILTLAVVMLSPYKHYFYTWFIPNHLHYQNVSSPPSPPPNVSVSLQQRLQTTQQWLAQADAHHYSIQILQTPASQTENLIRLLAQPEIQPLLPALYVYQPRVDDNRRLWRLLYGEFADAQAASAAITQLPEQLQRNKPLLRKIIHLRESL
ncbi:MAG: AAA family ATPase [Pseudomonadota bacterium]|nr:AAA family ATPase [Pseudomonadota bacterium]